MGTVRLHVLRDRTRTGLVWLQPLLFPAGQELEGSALNRDKQAGNIRCQLGYYAQDVDKKTVPGMLVPGSDPWRLINPP